MKMSHKPFEDFFSDVLKPSLYVGDIDILPPRFLALPRSLLILLRGFNRGCHPAQNKGKPVSDIQF